MNIQRKYKYALLSLGIVIFLFSFSYTTGFLKIFSVFMAVLVATLGTALVQYSSVQTEHTLNFFIKRTYLSILVLPLVLILGSILSLVYFPNLGLPTRTLTIGAVGALMYAISLMNNIFLVVFERGEVIPLYRVALTWSQILLIVVSIPFFSGIFKLPVNSIYQSLVVAGASGLFASFLWWAQEMDPEVPDIDSKEELLNSLFVAFVVFVFSISTSFFPSESFLRALLVSSVLMSALGYLQAHYKNVITKKLIMEYVLITFVFLLFVLFFN